MVLILKKTSRQSKIIVPPERLLKIITILRVLFGCYTNISKSKPIGYFIRIYCTSLTSAIVGVYFFYNYAKSFNSRSPFTKNHVVLIEFLINAIIYSIFGDEHFTNYFNAIKTSDRIMGFKKMPLVPNYTYVAFCVHATIRCFIIGIKSITSLYIHNFLTIASALISIDINNITIVIIYSIMHSRIRRLRLFLESYSVPLHITGKDEVSKCIIYVRKSLFNYHSLLDNMQSKLFYTQLQCLLSTCYVSNLLRFMFSIFSVIKTYSAGISVLEIISVTLETTIALLSIIIPGLIVEATASEVEKIRAALVTQILRCSDESLRFELETVLQYVSLRPFRVMIARAVPLDINMPVTIITICVTYLIVILQLTHYSII